MGAYQFLLDWHLTEYLKDPDRWLKGKRPPLERASGGVTRLSIEERKRILMNNIYGVDIDPQAVEVTKLSLLLKVLEGEGVAGADVAPARARAARPGPQHQVRQLADRAGVLR